MAVKKTIMPPKITISLVTNSNKLLSALHARMGIDAEYMPVTMATSAEVLAHELSVCCGEYVVKNWEFIDVLLVP